MTSASLPLESGNRLWVSAFYKVAYQAISYFGLFSVFGAILYGFRYNPAAPAGNVWFNVMLYLAFIVPHLIMTRGWFKRIVWGTPYSTPQERRFYILFTTVTWLAVLWFQRPTPGGALVLPEPVRFAGTIGFLVCLLVFFQGINFDVINGMLGVPGAVSRYSHGPETPLFTDGPYAHVRHPMYRGALLAGCSALAIHPNTGQLLWTAMVGLTFVLFIPVEEAQMIAARGDDYRRYQLQTPYRLFKGIW